MRAGEIKIQVSADTIWTNIHCKIIFCIWWYIVLQKNVDTGLQNLQQRTLRIKGSVTVQLV